MTMEVLVVGGGRVGGTLAALLAGADQQVRVLEQDPVRARELAELLGEGRVHHADATDPDVLEAVGIQRAHVLVAVTGIDATNLVVAGLARLAYRVPRVVARINDPAHAWLFTPTLGVDAAVNQTDLLARLVLEELSIADVATLVKLRRGDLNLIEEVVTATSRAVGRQLGDLQLPTGCVLVAILRGEEVLSPGPQLRLQPGDEVLAVAHGPAAAALSDALAE